VVQTNSIQEKVKRFNREDRMLRMEERDFSFHPEYPV